MALVIQSLPPVTGANSYADVQEFKDYCTARLKVITGKTDEQITAALLDGTDFLDRRFRYVGYRVDPGQELEWPRQNAYDNRNDRVVGVPPQVKRATIEYAFRALNGALWPDPVAGDDSGRQIKSKSSKVGPIEESVEYADRAGHEMPYHPMVDLILVSRGLVCGGTTSGLSSSNIALG